MESNRNGTSNIRGFNSAALELNDDKCAICYLELQERAVEATCGHRYRDCIIRYHFKLGNCMTKRK